MTERTTAPGRRLVAVVTTSRADVSILRPVVDAIAADPRLDLLLVVGGGHLASHRGGSQEWFGAELAPAAVERADFLLAADDPAAVVASMGLSTIRHGEIFARRRPDVVFVTGDRTEMHAAAVAAVPLGIPLAHLHGGELSYGAIDDAFRHSLTKLAVIHFASTDEHAARIRQMGAEPASVHVTGAPALHLLRAVRRLDPAALADRVGVAADDLTRTLLVTFHPVTREPGAETAQLDELTSAIDDSGLPAVVTMPNADAGGLAVRDRLHEWHDAAGDRIHLHEELGAEAFFSMMAYAAAMVGNSSSGIVEAASFGLPVVNVGERQAGRQRAANIIDVEASRDDIRAAIDRATSGDFRAALAGLVNPYERADAGAAIADVLATADLEQARRPRFHDLGDRTGDPS